MLICDQLSINQPGSIFLFSSQVSVTAREDVPPFGPVLPDPPIFTEVRNNTKVNKTA